MRAILSSALAAFLLAASALPTHVRADAAAGEKQSPCLGQKYQDTDYIICRFGKEDTIRLFHADEEGRAFRHFRRLASALESDGEALVFAMNAGMYDRNRNPIGLYVEKGVRKKSANTNDGPGNFHLKPNGVFYIMADGAAGVKATDAYLKAAIAPAYATQSGPMLVIDGALHAKFLVDSKSRKRRNGVGVTNSGEIIFVLADSPVTFHAFASFFKDYLKIPNALYLDGVISRLHAPELGRNDAGIPMGPIIAVTAPAE